MTRRPVKPTLHEGLPKPPQTSVSPPPAAIPGNVSGAEDTVRTFRPILRPPMAILEVLDDGSDKGEEFRVRSDTTIVGRANSEIVIPHDDQISGNHVRLSRRIVENEYHWFLTDLGSTNGTFLRVTRSLLVKGTTFIMGSYRYQYRPAQAAASTDVPKNAPAGTRGWKAPSADDLQRLSSALVRITSETSEQAFLFDDDEVTIGSDSQTCGIVIDDDPALSRQHALLRKTDKGLIVEDSRSLNGLWIAVKERRLSGSAIFQIGEQRIRFKVL